MAMEREWNQQKKELEVPIMSSRQYPCLVSISVHAYVHTYSTVYMRNCIIGIAVVIMQACSALCV